MPPKYHSISPMVWDRHFRRLSKDAKIVAFYIWSAPARSTEGLSRIPVSYTVGDTGLSEDEVLTSLKELQTAGFICYHEETETLLDLLSLKWNPIKNGVNKQTGEVTVNKRLPGALRQLESLTDSPLIHVFAQLASRLSPDFGFAIYEKFPWLQTPDKSLLEAPDKPLTSPFVAPPKGRVEKSRAATRQEESEKSCAFASEVASDSESGLEAPSNRAASLSTAVNSIRSTFPSAVDDLDGLDLVRQERAVEEWNDRIGELAGGRVDMMRGWNWLDHTRPCVVCNRECLARDPDGRPRHPCCGVAL